MDKIRVFISYSQSESVYCKLVYKLSEILKDDNFEVIIDKNGLKENPNLNHFMEKSITESDVILIICTPDYKTKAEGRIAGVGYETNIISSIKMKGYSKKIIPILLNTDPKNSIPTYMISDIYYNIGDDFESTDFKSKYKELKQNIISSLYSLEFNIRNYMKINDEFLKFLNDVGMFDIGTNKIRLKDVFVYPQFRCVGSDGDFCNISGTELVEKIKEGGIFVISGKDQFGKSALAKILFEDLFQEKLVPLLLNKEMNFKSNIESFFEEIINMQYSFFKFNEDLKKNSVLMIDDFHLFIKGKQELLAKDFANYHAVVLIVDDVYEFNLKNRDWISTSNRFSISEFSPSMRNELIKKWIDCSRPDLTIENDIIEIIDQKTNLIDNTLGRAIRRGLMPSTPFFILSIISTYESFDITINRDITSQGHCYQALIFFNLRKNGIAVIQIDAYINFLSEFSYFIYSKGTYEISNLELESFFNLYKKEYNLPGQDKEVIEKLINSKIIYKNSLGMYKFYYPYVYYYFLGKYISDNYSKCESLVGRLVENLHQDKNAYICIFLLHHNKDDRILDEILLIAMCLFDEFSRASLLLDDISFFSKEENPLIEKSIPKVKNYEEKRKEKLSIQDNLEEESLDEDGFYQDNIDDQEISDYEKNLRKSFRTVEVIGTIVRNKSGSLKKDMIENLLEEGISINLRIIKSFLSAFSDEERMNEFIDAIVNKIIENFEREKNGNEKLENMSAKEIRKKIENILGYLGFELIINLLKKSITSIGSKEVLNNVNEVCDRINTPSSLIIKHGINMWYGKTLDIKNIDKDIKQSGFNIVSKKIMVYFIMDYCSNHKIHRTDIDKLVSVFEIDKRKFYKNLE